MAHRRGIGAVGSIGLVAFALCSCAGTSAQHHSQPAAPIPPTSRVAMTATPRPALSLCRKAWLVRPVCPRRVPWVAGKPGRQGGALAGCSGGPHLDNVPITSKQCRLAWWNYQVAVPPQVMVSMLPRWARSRDISWTHPPGQPWTAHVLIYASTVGNPLPFPLPPARAHARRLTDALLYSNRLHAVSLGNVRWSGRDGELVLAPPFGPGGMPAITSSLASPVAASTTRSPCIRGRRSSASALVGGRARYTSIRGQLK